MVTRIIIFLIINFGALGIGGMFTGTGVASDWYQNLAKAPWTPPGWVFGAAWTIIMICFSYFMAVAFAKTNNITLLVTLFIIQLILNISWNPVFFKYHQMLLGLVIISVLTVLMGYFLFKYYKELKSITLLILPYFVWLVIATSLNAYAYLKN